MTPRLYVFARTDMDSMTPGRVAAQVSHATSRFHMHGERLRERDHNASTGLIGEEDRFLTGYLKWIDEADGFGTIIVLEAPYGFTDVEEPEVSDTLLGYGSCFDPEYAIRDGTVTHFVNVETCRWALIDMDQLGDERLFWQFGLYSG